VDLYGPSWTLLTPAGSGWAEAARRAERVTGVPLAAIEVAPDGRGRGRTRWAKAYGLGRTGAVLVRPDGHVGWRVADAPADADTVVAVLRSLLHVTPGRLGSR